MTTEELASEIQSLSKEDLMILYKQMEIGEVVVDFFNNCHKSTKGHKMKCGSGDGFNHLKELYEDGHLFKDIVIMGASQIGKTDWLIISVLAMAYNGLNVFFVLPTLQFRDKYVPEKVMKPISTSDRYQKIVKKGVSKSVDQIQFGKGIIRFVGGNVPADMTSFSADAIVIDETDQIDMANIELGMSRISGSTYKFRRLMSNPTDEKGFIGSWYEKSDKRIWKCPCDSCGVFTSLDWFKTVVREIEDDDGVVINRVLRDEDWYPGCNRDILIKCPEEGCEGSIDRTSDEAYWEPTSFSEQNIVGYHMPSLLSYNMVNVSDLWYEYMEALESPSKMSAFYSMRLALPYSETGHKLSQGVLKRCQEEEYLFEIFPDCAYSSFTSEGPCAMGIDTSPSHLDINIKQLVKNKGKTVYIGKVDPGNFSVLHDLIERYNVEIAVIDIDPEHTLAKNFQDSAKCTVWRCKYLGVGDERDQKYNFNRMIISVDQTEALDKAYTKYRVNKVILPENYDKILNGTFVKEMKALSRITTEDHKGKLKHKWVGSTHNHSRHADSYCNLALEEMMFDTIGSSSIFIL
jgi:hypothetical protein